MDIQPNEPVVAFTLARYPKRASFSQFARLGLDRLPLSFTHGLRFWRLFGVGRGQVFDPHADLQRYAMFTIWDSYTALRCFEARSSIMRRTREHSEEAWTVHMYPVRWHGRWGGRDPFARMTPALAPEPGPWVILTRATLYPHKIRSFLQAVPAVAEQLVQQPDYINSVGVGEIPLVRQATLSVWRTLPSITAFAYGTTPHRDVIRRTREERWYSEELFARFRPVESCGTWDGSDPLR